MKTNNVICFVLLLATFVQTTSAQEKERANALDAKTWSLLYGVNGLLQFNPFDGMIAAKYNRSANSALRFGVGVHVREFDANEMSNSRITANLLFVKYPNIDREVLFYFGAGPQLEFAHQGTDREDFEQSINIVGVGANGILGSEWFATEHISLFVEYGLNVQVRFFDIDQLNGPTGAFQDYSIDNIITAGLSTYF